MSRKLSSCVRSITVREVGQAFATNRLVGGERAWGGQNEAREWLPRSLR